jgi:hypothetical protein
MIRGKTLGNLTFIGISLIGFVIIFILLRILPRVKGKNSDPSIAQHASPTPHRTSHPQSTGPKKVYRI